VAIGNSENGTCQKRPARSTEAIEPGKLAANAFREKLAPRGTDSQAPVLFVRACLDAANLQLAPVQHLAPGLLFSLVLAVPAMSAIH
jgi:hypothetical protein